MWIIGATEAVEFICFPKISRGVWQIKARRAKLTS
jgi:hypothetical protein